MQQKTHRPVQFEPKIICLQVGYTRRLNLAQGNMRASLMIGCKKSVSIPRRTERTRPDGPRRPLCIVDDWVEEIGLDPAAYGTHSIQRTKPTLIYRRTKNLRAVQVLLGHTKLESTVRYLGIEVDDALEIAEQTEA